DQARGDEPAGDVGRLGPGGILRRPAMGSDPLDKAVLDQDTGLPLHRGSVEHRDVAQVDGHHARSPLPDASIPARRRSGDRVGEYTVGASANSPSTTSASSAGSHRAPLSDSATGVHPRYSWTSPPCIPNSCPEMCAPASPART